MSILAQQLRNPQIKPKWWGSSLGMVESLVRYNCMKKGFPVPVLAMPFWENGGNRAFDVSGKRNHGTLTNGVTWVGGRSGTTVRFDGTNDYVITNAKTIVNPNLSDLTISMWINATTFLPTAGVNPRIIMHNIDGNNVWMIALSNDTGTVNTFTFIIRENAITYQNTTASTWGTNTWYHVVATWNYTTNTQKIYVNGVNQSLVVQTTFALGNADNKVWIGARNTLTGYFSGRMDNAQIYNCAFTPAQVKFLYDNPYFMFEMPEELWGYKTVTILDYERASMRGSHRGIMVGVG